MSVLFSDFQEAQRIGDGNLLASCLAPTNTISDHDRINTFSDLTNFHMVHKDIMHHIVEDRNAIRLPKSEANQWIEVFVLLWKCVKELAAIQKNGKGNWDVAFKAYKDLCTNLCRGYTNYGFQAWTIPCMSVAGKYLRLLAIQADEQSRSTLGGNAFSNGLSDDIAEAGATNATLQDAARTLQQMISVCRSDDSDLTESRKWGVISMANLLFKTYFKLNNLALTRNVIAILESPGVNLPPLTAFPKSHQCTYSYYRGVLEFLKEDYENALKYLEQALAICPIGALRNREQILTYLIPANILTNQKLPAESLLLRAPELNRLLSPICQAVRSGNLAAFDKALNTVEIELIRRRIYLTIERLRDLCMRNLFRKVYLSAGFEETKDVSGQSDVVKVRRTRLGIDEFETAIRVAYRGSEEPIVVDRDEVECYLANMIYKGYMKGYIAREQSKVVLSKSGAFPGTNI